MLCSAGNLFGYGNMSGNSIWGQGAIKQISNDLQNDFPEFRQSANDELKVIQNFGADIDLGLSILENRGHL